MKGYMELRLFILYLLYYCYFQRKYKIFGKNIKLFFKPYIKIFWELR